MLPGGGVTGKCTGELFCLFFKLLEEILKNQPFGWRKALLWAKKSTLVSHTLGSGHGSLLGIRDILDNPVKFLDLLLG
eukprot:2353052-Ditylum_brightwellii.AAC.1